MSLRDDTRCVLIFDWVDKSSDMAEPRTRRLAAVLTGMAITFDASEYILRLVDDRMLNVFQIAADGEAWRVGHAIASAAMHALDSDQEFRRIGPSTFRVRAIRIDHTTSMPTAA